MPGLRQQAAFRRPDTLSPIQREKLLEPYLPREPMMVSPTTKTKQQASTSPRSFHHRQRVRPAMRQLLHLFLFHAVHTIFSIYVRLRQIYHALYDRVCAVLYYHHRTPELIKRDVKPLNRVPKHLSFILELPPEGKKDALSTLLNDACELVAWSASAGIPMLSMYEKTGILKASLPHLHRRITRTLTSYYGTSSPQKPNFSLRSPNLLLPSSSSPPYSPPPHSPEREDANPPPQHTNILLLDSTDGRQTLVDLTKTLTEMSQSGKLSPADISQELIDAEITESVMGEPDLLIVFGDKVVLEGYPPWQIRLTEIFYAQDNVGGVGYQIFLRALYRYAKAEFRFGR